MLKDDGKLALRNCSMTTFISLETHWAKIFDFYYKGYDGSHDLHSP